jgi:L-ribulokinase
MVSIREKEEVIVVGVDFGTQSVRASIFSNRGGRLGSATAEIPILRSKEDSNWATQRHQDHMDALVRAIREAVKKARVHGEDISALALDTTGSTVVPVGANLEPLDDYYLWCDHRATAEAAEISNKGRRANLEALEWCGGVYSSEWGFSKLLHWLRHNPERAGKLTTAFEHCDMVVAVLCAATDPATAPRSICAMGHKWMWNEELGGLPSEDFLTNVDQRLLGMRAKLSGHYATSDQIAGRLSAKWAARLGLRTGIPIPMGALDAHWDAIGAGIREGDVVNVIGTSTCIMAIAKQIDNFPSVCGVVRGSIHPDYYGIEAGLSATGDIFDAIARRASTNVAELAKGLQGYSAGQTGLLRLVWDNGDRTVLANPHLSGVTFGWKLTHTAQDELFAAIEGTAFHTRIIMECMAQHGVPIRQLINGGGIPQKNEALNQVYANVLNKPVLVPQDDVTSLGSAIFAFLAAGAFRTVEEAQNVLCPSYRTLDPQPIQAAVYEKLHPIFRDLYFQLGKDDTLASLELIARETMTKPRPAKVGVL